MSYAESLRCQGVEEGITKGKKLGVEEGLSRGRLEGKREGKREGKKEGKREGKREGKKEGILQTAANLLRQGVEMGTILLATGLQREQLLQLQEQRRYK